MVVSQPRRSALRRVTPSEKSARKKKTGAFSPSPCWVDDDEWNKENVPPGCVKAAADHGPVVRLGGSWGEREEKVASLETLVRRLERELRAARTEVECSRQRRSAELAEAAAWKALQVEREADLKAAAHEAVEASARARHAQDRLGMAQSDLEAGALARQADRADRDAALEVAQVAQAELERSMAKLERADADNLRLAETNVKLERVRQQLQTRCVGETRAKDLLLHAKTQKERQLVTVLKEKDRLREKLLQHQHRDADRPPPRLAQPATSFDDYPPPTSTLEAQAATIRTLRAKLDKKDACLAAKTRDLDKAKQANHNLSVRLANLKAQLDTKTA